MPSLFEDTNIRSDWAAEYYEIIEFYFWEPQHIGRTPKSKMRLGKPHLIVEHAAKHEVSLNHVMNIFFRLVGDDFKNRWFAQSFKNYQLDRYHLTTRGQTSSIKATQPDLYFLGNINAVAMELKITAQTSADQFIKYAVLQHYMRKKTGMNCAPYLLFMTPSGAEERLVRKHKSVRSILDSIEDNHIQEVLRKARMEKELTSEIRDILNVTSVHVASYRTFREHINTEISEIEPNQNYAQTYRLLLQGMVDELVYRGLA